MKRWSHLAVAAAVVAVMLWWGSCRNTSETKQDVVQKAAIAQADTQKVEAVTSLHKVRNATDKVLADPKVTVLPKPVVKVIVDAERAACDSTIRASERQTETRDTRVKTLEKRANTFLSLYAEAGLRARLVGTPEARAEAEVGVEVSLDHTTALQVGVTSDQEVTVRVQKRLRLF